MYRKSLTLIFVVLFWVNLAYAQKVDWLQKLNQIVPLQSVKTDVERLFGKPIKYYDNNAEYRTKMGVLSVTYSTGKCNSNLSNYAVDKEVVIDLDLSFEKKVDLKSLNLNLEGFRKEKSNDTQNIIYRNEKEGISYDVYKKNKVGVSYDRSPELLNVVSKFPAEKYFYLECKNSTAK